MSKMFEPSADKLTAMVAFAMAKFDADREQSILREEASKDAKVAKAWIAEVKQRRYRVHGVISCAF